jgi:transporter family-2 protein
VAAFGAPRIGVGPLLTAAIAGQLVGAVVLDHFGLLGLARQPVSMEKIAGVALVLLGAWLVRRG